MEEFRGQLSHVKAHDQSNLALIKNPYTTKTTLFSSTFPQQKQRHKQQLHRNSPHTTPQWPLESLSSSRTRTSATQMRTRTLSTTPPLALLSQWTMTSTLEATTTTTTTRTRASIMVQEPPLPRAESIPQSIMLRLLRLLASH